MFSLSLASIVTNPTSVKATPNDAGGGLSSSSSSRTFNHPSSPSRNRSYLRSAPSPIVLPANDSNPEIQSPTFPSDNTDSLTPTTGEVVDENISLTDLTPRSTLPASFSSFAPTSTSCAVSPPSRLPIRPATTPPGSNLPPFLRDAQFSAADQLTSTVPLRYEPSYVYDPTEDAIFFVETTDTNPLTPHHVRCSSLSYTLQASPPPTLSSVSNAKRNLSTTQLSRHPDLWFCDGSVILRAENTLFRVHMSQLSRHSECFRDTFSMPQPRGEVWMGPNGLSILGSTTRMNGSSHVILPIDGGGYERIPVLVLHDDPEDVRHLLAALYDGPSFGNNRQNDFKVVSGVLRLATKYIIDSLRSKATEHLSMAWPSTLKGWDLREDLARAHEQETNDNTHLYPHPIAVINLAREVNAPSLLPAAFYDLSRYSYTQIFEPTEDDTLFQPSPQASLSTHDMQCLCLGKEAAQHSITSLISAMGSSHYIRQSSTSPSPLTFSSSSNAIATASTSTTHHISISHIRKTSGGGICLSAAACRKDFCELVELATQHYLFDRERGWCDPLYVAEELGQLKSTEFSECKACARSLEVWAARERERMWKLLPVWFRLDGLGNGWGHSDGSGGAAGPRNGAGGNGPPVTAAGI